MEKDIAELIARGAEIRKFLKDAEEKVEKEKKDINEEIIKRFEDMGVSTYTDDSGNKATVITKESWADHFTDQDKENIVDLRQAVKAKEVEIVSRLEVEGKNPTETQEVRITASKKEN